MFLILLGIAALVVLAGGTLGSYMLYNNARETQVFVVLDLFLLPESAPVSFASTAGFTSLSSVVHGKQLQRAEVSYLERVNGIRRFLQSMIDSYGRFSMLIADGFSVFGELSPYHYKRFVEEALYRQTGLLGVGWAPYVRESEYDAYVNATRPLLPGLGLSPEIIAQGPIQYLDPATGKRVRHTNSSRGYYVPVKFVEPLAPNRAAVTFDLASNAVRRAGIVAARDSCRVRATSRMNLLQRQSPGRPSWGISLFAPAYRHTADTYVNAP